MINQTFHIRIQQEEDGSFYAFVDELPGCYTAGDSIDEIKDMMPEAISAYLEAQISDLLYKKIKTKTHTAHILPSFTSTANVSIDIPRSLVYA